MITGTQGNYYFAGSHCFDIKIIKETLNCKYICVLVTKFKSLYKLEIELIFIMVILGITSTKDRVFKVT